MNKTNLSRRETRSLPSRTLPLRPTTLFLKVVLSKRFFISFNARGGVSGPVQQRQEQTILPLIYFNIFSVNNCNVAYQPLLSPLLR